MPKQYALWAAERPDTHGEYLHSGPRHGTVIVWEQRGLGRQWHKIEPQDDLAQLLSTHAGGDDRFLSVNEFKGWRLVRLLASLRALYVDLDQSLTAHNLSDWPSVVEAVEDLGLPRPSLVVLSGRGLHLYWALEPLPARALPVWQACEHELAARLQALGADRSATDCTRVLRLAGTLNSRSSTVTHGYVTSQVRWSLRQIAAEILCRPDRPPTSIVAARAKRAATTAQRVGPWRLWHGRYAALTAIADHHSLLQPTGISEGNRDRMLFLLATALSWFTRADSLEAEILEVARMYTPTLTPDQAATYTSAVRTRACEAAAGETREWRGDQVDPRYRFRTARLRQELGPLLAPDVLALPVVQQGLGLLSQDERERRAAERSAGRYRDHYTGAGVRASNEEARATARLLRAQGRSLRQIATELGCALRTVQRWLADEGVSQKSLV